MDERDLKEWSDNIYVPRHIECPHCHERIVPDGPSRWWRTMLPIGYALLAVLVVAAAFSGFLVVFALPAALAVGIGVMVIREYASELPSCPRCGHELGAEESPLFDSRHSAT